MAHNYTLQVTAGPEYDAKTHKIVAVNTAEPVCFENDAMSVELNVRVQDYRGLPKNSPATSPYFSLPQHAKSKDAYSITFAFTPKEDINGDDLVFGNDFDHPIRDRLPPGFGTAFRMVKWVIDPGLDGDVYSDRPYLYGPAGSSLNVLRVGEKGAKSDVKGKGGEGMVFEEGGEGDGVQLREDNGVPAAEAARKKWFLTEANRKKWTWEASRTCYGDFYNAYLDFNEFALKLPGFTLPIMKYWDGQGLRYVLKNRKTGKVYMVVLFTLYLNEDVDEEGNIKAGVEGGKPGYGGSLEEDKEVEEGKEAKKEAETKEVKNDDDDDVD